VLVLLSLKGGWVNECERDWDLLEEVGGGSGWGIHKVAYVLVREGNARMEMVGRCILNG